MLSAIIYLLIYVCVIALVIYLVIWVLRDVIGLALPPKVLQILWVIFALFVLLYILQLVLGGGGLHLPQLK